MTYAELDSKILDTFRNMPLINSVTNNSLTWNEHKNTQYPAFAADLQNVTVSNENGTANYNYVFSCGMIGVESEVDRISNYSRLMQLLYDGIEKIQAYADITTDPVFQFGSLKYMDVLDIATCTLTITTDMELDCE